MQTYLEKFRECKSGLANSYIALVANATLQSGLSEQVSTTESLLLCMCETMHWCLVCIKLHTHTYAGRIMAPTVSVCVQDSAAKKEKKEEESRLFTGSGGSV